MAWDDEMAELGGLWLTKSGKAWHGTLDATKLEGLKPPLKLLLTKNAKHEPGDNKPAFRLFVRKVDKPQGSFKAEQAADQGRGVSQDDEDAGL